MSVYVVTRHQGALDWLNQEKVQFDRHILHLAIDQLQPGDGVIGNLPVPMVADLTAMGVRYWHLSFDVPLELRGVELSADQLRKLGIQLRAYRVEPD